jgi:hypothetical protein
MAVGAIPPPLFFEQRRFTELVGSGHGILREASEHPIASTGP